MRVTASVNVLCDHDLCTRSCLIRIRLNDSVCVACVIIIIDCRPALLRVLSSVPTPVGVFNWTHLERIAGEGEHDTLIMVSSRC
jgi:hypothetical protein